MIFHQELLRFSIPRRQSKEERYFPKKQTISLAEPSQERYSPCARELIASVPVRPTKAQMFDRRPQYDMKPQFHGRSNLNRHASTKPNTRMHCQEQGTCGPLLTSCKQTAIQDNESPPALSPYGSCSNHLGSGEHFVLYRDVVPTQTWRLQRTPEASLLRTIVGPERTCGGIGFYEDVTG